MKVGILTLHSQINYGGVLQTYALQTTLEHLGHQAIVLDFWKTNDNRELLGPFLPENLKYWLSMAMRSLLATGTEGRLLRHWRTINFINKQLHLSPFHFLSWNNLSEKDLNLDCIVIGSDQVWHAWDDTLGVFLLHQAPKIPAISYAASIGMQQLPGKLLSLYHTGWKRFNSLSVREKQAVQMMAEQGFETTHVLDPVLLLSNAAWYSLTKVPLPKKQKRLVCYFMDSHADNMIQILAEYARKTDYRIDVFVDNVADYCVSLPTNMTKTNYWRKWLGLRFGSSVHLHLGAGPKEFVKTFSQATDVITNSFHGTMFAILFGANIRVLRPTVEFRKLMFSRIEEFQEFITQGRWICDNLNDAICSIINETKVVFDEAAIQRKREESLKWLASALNQISNV